jgi:hypothetical protein
MIKKTFLLLFLVSFITHCSLIPMPPEAQEALDDLRTHLKGEPLSISLFELPLSKIGAIAKEKL